MRELKLQFWAIPGLRRQEMPKTVTPKSSIVKSICDVVCTHLNLTLSQLQVKSRKRELVRGRYILMRMLKQYTELSLKEIGEVFKSKEDASVKRKALDHTTVIHGIASLRDEIATNDDVRKIVHHLEFTIEETILKS